MYFSSFMDPQNSGVTICPQPGSSTKSDQKPIPCYQSTKLGVNKIQVILPIQKKRDKRERKKKKKEMNE